MASRQVRKIARKIYRAIPFKQPLFELLRRHVPLPERVYRHLSFTGVIETEVEGASFRMRHFGYVIENELFWSGIYGSWEGASLRVWVKAARQAGVILDVGANTGLYALAAKAVAPDAEVTAFEPVERIRSKLRANVELNGFDIRVDASAVSDRDGEGVLLDTVEEHEISATLDPAGETRSGRARSRVTVPLARLDTLVARGVVGAPDLLKIDVEGHEPAVLLGMVEQLRRKRPSLLIEVLTAEAAAQVDAIVRPLGYVVHRLDAAGPSRLDAVEPAPGTNLFLCSTESAAALFP
jgi:FkbM family methyltransferase